MRTIDIRRLFRAGAGTTLAAVLAVCAAAGAVLAGFFIGGVSTTVLFLHALALLGIGLALRQAKQARAVADKLSADIDACAGRLLGLESRLSDFDRQAYPAMRSTLAEVTGEISLLGNLVRDLAVTVAAHDRTMADLKGRDAPPKAPAVPRPAVPPAEPVPLPPAPPLPRLVLASLAPEPPRPAPAPAAVEVRDPLPDAPAVATERAPLAADPAEARRIAAIVEALEADRIEIHLQPIVSLPQRKPRLYEALARLRLADDAVLVPAEFLPLIERLGLAAELDRRVVSRAGLVARHLVGRGSDALVTCNLSPRSLAEPGFLRSIGRAVEAAPDTIGRVALEISQRCWRTLDAERAGALAALRDRGVPFVLDRAGDLRLDPLALADRGVRYLKLPAEMLLRPDTSRGLDIAMPDLAAVLARAGIRLVAERVEREEDVPDLIDLDVPLAQGFVFAPPRAVRPEVLGSPAPAEPAPKPTPTPEPAPAPAREPVPPAAARAPAAEERLPYRAFLRRAG